MANLRPQTDQRDRATRHLTNRSGLRLVAESIVKGVDDLLLEVIPPRMRLDYRLPVSVEYVKEAKSEDVHFYARCHEGHFRLLVLVLNLELDAENPALQPEALIEAFQKHLWLSGLDVWRINV